MAWVWPTKDPDEFLDYGFDWAERLEPGETIVTSTWFINEALPEIELSDESVVSNRYTLVWISGGAVGERYSVTNRLTTSVGRIYDETARIRVRER